MPQTTVPAFLLALRGSLAARPGLANVNVQLVPTGDTTGRDSVILVNNRIEGEQTRFAMNHVRQDAYRIPGQLDAFGADPDTDVAFQQAFSRAGVILDEIINELEHNKPFVGSSTLDGLMSTVGYTPFTVDNGGWVCRCDFVIEYQATVS